VCGVVRAIVWSDVSIAFDNDCAVVLDKDNVKCLVLFGQIVVK